MLEVKTQAQMASKLISRRDKLAREYFALNYPNMTMEQAIVEADFWCAYLQSGFHDKPGQISQNNA
jgi:hypothetical protein